MSRKLAVSAEARARASARSAPVGRSASGRARRHGHVARQCRRGNRAQGLYQRFGFEEQPHQDGVGECCECCFVTLCFGRRSSRSCKVAGWGKMRSWSTSADRRGEAAPSSSSRHAQGPRRRGHGARERARRRRERRRRAAAGPHVRRRRSTAPSPAEQFLCRGTRAPVFTP